MKKFQNVFFFLSIGFISYLPFLNILFLPIALFSYSYFFKKIYENKDIEDVFVISMSYSFGYGIFSMFDFFQGAIELRSLGIVKSTIVFIFYSSIFNILFSLCCVLFKRFFLFKGVVLKSIGFSFFVSYSFLLTDVVNFPVTPNAYMWWQVPEIYQNLSLLGIYGLTFLTILFLCTPYIVFSFRNDRKKLINSSVSFLILFISMFFYGKNRIESNTQEIVDEKPVIRIMHTTYNMKNSKKQFDKYLKNIPLENMKKSIKMIVWPESTFRMVMFDSKQIEKRTNPMSHWFSSDLKGFSGIISYESSFFQLYDKYKHVQNGILNKNQVEKRYNSIIFINSEQKVVDMYQKRRLAPIVEYIPFPRMVINIFKYFGFYKKPSIPNLSHGSSDKVLSTIDNIGTFIPLICYESILPLRISYKDIKKSQFILVSSNEEWMLSKLPKWMTHIGSIARSIELGIPMIRSTNGGVTSVVDSYGRAIKIINDSDKNEYIDTHIPKSIEGRTIYSRFDKYIYEIFSIISIIILLPGIIMFFRRRKT